MTITFLSPSVFWFAGAALAFFLGVFIGIRYERKRWIPGEVGTLGVSYSDEDIADRVQAAMRRGHPICQEITNVVGETMCREIKELASE